MHLKSIGILFLAASSAAWAHSAGADPGLTGSPGDAGDTCTLCHGPLNNARGSAKINFPGTSYTPGQTYRMSVLITDPVARRWGFELGAWQSSNVTTKQAGTLASADGNTRIITQSSWRYITHTSAGTRPGSTGSLTFEFDWTAPAAGTGEVSFYAAANAANNNGNNDPGDFIYSTSLKIPEAASGPTPTLRDSQPALPSFLGSPAGGFASNAYLELYGTNLSNTTRPWAGGDFNGSNAPTSLDGVSVKVNGKPAFVYYISPTQININTPDDPATGPVSIEVNNNGATSNTITYQKGKTAPAMLTTPAFLIGGKQYIAALQQDLKTFVGQTGLIAGVGFQPVKPGDRIIIYALGCGPTSPSTSGGVVTAVNSPVSSPYELHIGGQKATVEFFGAVPGAIGLYQINVVIPNVGAGDQPIELIVDGVNNSQGLFLSGVQN
jgi:uncharacterized protein (TIGR03437 family)